MCRYPVENNSYDLSSTKAFLLFQAHFGRLPLPCADYYTDLKSVLDQAIRIIQAMIDILAESGFLIGTLRMIHILQMTIQARWIEQPAILTLPHIEVEHLPLFAAVPKALPVLCSFARNSNKSLKPVLEDFAESHKQKVFINFFFQRVRLE